jgi:transcriptional regulator with XRE-family HTH domain
MAKKKKTFAEAEKEILGDPRRRANVERHRAAMQTAIRLGELRERLDATQTELAAFMGTTQANVSRIEHSDNVYLSTLADYIGALGGQLEINAVFDDRVIPLAAIAEEKSRGRRADGRA